MVTLKARDNHSRGATLSKRLSRDHLGFVRAVLRDCADYYPTLSVGFERDLLRLESHAANVGDRVFLLDLPAIAKLLDKAMASGVLTATGLALTRPINCRTPIPRLFQGLWLRLFDSNGCLLSNADPTALFFLREILSGQKKYRKECSKEVLYETVSDYYSVDQALPPPSRLWDDGGVPDYSLGRPALNDRSTRLGLFDGKAHFGVPDHLCQMLDDVQSVCDVIASSLGEFLPSAERFKHGPGATAEFKRGEGYKYLFPNWSRRLQDVFPGEEYAVANSSILGGGLATTNDLFGDARVVEGGGEIADLYPEMEEASRLIAVPKTQKAPRLIAAEPTCNQWTQQNVKNYLTRQVRLSFLGNSIDFKRQDLSQRAAHLGSVDGRSATVDLSAASDRVSCYLVERVFRANVSLLEAFAGSRTRFIRQSIDRKSPQLHKLRKFSSMGSALTFPVQSILFYSLVVGVGYALSRTRRQQRTMGRAVRPTQRSVARIGRLVRVYGDDLIFPVEWVPRVVELFEHLHLKVNQDKTFAEGNFRESCGLDAWNGYDVTPAYFLEFPNETAFGSIATTVAMANNLYMKGLWRTSAWVERLVPNRYKRLIPIVPIGSNSFGFYSASGFRTSGDTRWNEHLQKSEYRTLQLVENRDKKRHEGFANLLQFFTEEPTDSSLHDWVSGVLGKSTGLTLRKAWAGVEDAFSLSPRTEFFRPLS